MRDAAVLNAAIIFGAASTLLYLFLTFQFSLPAFIVAFQHHTPGPKSRSQMVSVDLGWYPPTASWQTNLTSVVNGTGVHGFIFNSSALPGGVQYGTYDWCNMPHVRKSEYPVPGSEFELDYVELVCHDFPKNSIEQSSLSNMVRAAVS